MKNGTFEAMNQLTLAMRHDDDCVELHAAIRYQGFAGRGHCFFDPKALEKRAMLFAAFPIPADGGACIEGGYFQSESGTTQLAQTHLHLSIHSNKRDGNLALRVELAEPVDEHVSAFQAKLVCVVPISYEIAKGFSQAVIALLQRHNSEYVIGL